MIITIDGPVASGKSTAARMLAQKLNIYYLNTGLLYRGLGYLLLRREGYTLQNITNVSAEDLAVYADPQRLNYQYEEDEASISFDGKDLTSLLKTPEIDQAASIVSTNQAVREVLNVLQRHIAKDHDVVIEGRDSGSVVFPNADYKFFLTASAQVRAQRWRAKLAEKRVDVSDEQAEEQINERDARDSSRKIAPLMVPKDAIVIDDSELDQQETVGKILEIIKK